FFAKRARYPQFRRKDGKQSAEYTTSAFRWDGSALKLAKMDAPLDIRWSRPIPKAAKVTTVTVSKDTAGCYFVSLLCDDAVAAKPEASGKVGIDLGLTHFAILSTGEKVAAPNTYRKNQAKLAKLQRRLAKKTKGSNRRRKAKLKVAKLLVGIDKWYPSSKRCSDCGYTMPKMSLNVRQWTCPECGEHHDRDVNAARNVLAAGLAVSACGEAVSPVSF
ncbi:Transposase, partial [Lampropedia hyalina DSM 16112]